MVLQTYPMPRMLGMRYELVMWKIARSITDPDRSSVSPALLNMSTSSAVISPVFLKPTFHLPWNGWRPPEVAMSSSRSSWQRTGRPVWCAATASALARKMERDSLPPNPPPMRFTRQLMREAGTPSTLATVICVLVGFCVEEKISISPSSFLGTQMHACVSR